MFRSAQKGWVALALGASACGGGEDLRMPGEPLPMSPGPRQPAYLGFPGSDAWDGAAPLDAPGFPQRLSETGAFADTAALAPRSGIVEYEVQAPLWSDGAAKRRWASVPEGAAIRYTASDHLGFPPGTVLIKHFEVALDERFPEQRRRLETRFWIVASESQQYGITYKWNEDETDAELLRASETVQLSIVGPDGQPRSQRYFYPGSRECTACHNEQAGFVLGARVAQLNRLIHEAGFAPYEQLLAWSSWGLVDTPLDGSSAAVAPRLVSVADESASLQDRVRSYWDGNCSMCHAGDEGLVRGWDARFSTPFEDQGLFDPPRNSATGAPRLITPGAPNDSFIYLRADTTDFSLRMPPLGRNQVDAAYVELLYRWITSLEPTP